MVWFNDPFFTSPFFGPRLAVRNRRSRRSAPPFGSLGLRTDEKGSFLTAFLPGLGTDDVQLEVDGDQLTLRAERGLPAGLPEGAEAVRRERWQGTYERTLQLPHGVDAEAVDARFQNGVLEVRLPRPERELPVRIPVRANRIEAGDADSLRDDSESRADF